MRLGFLGAAALALGMPVAAQTAGARGVDPYVHPQQRVEIGPRRALNLVCMGSGERTVLFEAGGSDWSVIWALVQPEVARHARACAYDRAGLGYSDPAPGARSPIAIVEDMHALVAAAGLKRPLVLVGHSLGGFNAKLYAALYPEDVAALVLLDPAEERDWERTRPALEKTFGRALTARSELLDRSFRTDLIGRYGLCLDAAAAGPLAPSSLAYRRCSDPPRPQLGPVIAAERQRIQISPAYQKAQAREIIDSIYGGADSDQVYAGLFRAGMLGRRPVIVLTHGRFDAEDPLDLLGQEQALLVHRETARLSTRGLQRTVPDSGHNLPVEKPEVVISAVTEVLMLLGK